MKTKIVTVTTTRTFGVSVDKEVLTKEAMKEFSSYMFDVNHEDSLYGYIGASLQDREDIEFIEGIGEKKAKWSSELLEEDVEVEVHDE